MEKYAVCGLVADCSKPFPLLLTVIGTTIRATREIQS